MSFHDSISKESKGHVHMLLTWENFIAELRRKGTEQAHSMSEPL